MALVDRVSASRIRCRPARGGGCGVATGSRGRGVAGLQHAAVHCESYRTVGWDFALSMVGVHAEPMANYGEKWGFPVDIH